MSLILSATSPAITRVAVLIALITACVVAVLVVVGAVAAPDAQACGAAVARTARRLCW
jgi:hypothetical protein